MTTFLVKRFRMSVDWKGNPFRENSYLIYDLDSLHGLIIDPGSRSRKLEKFFAEQQIEVVGILNTHGHFDHSDGNAFYRQLFSVDVFASSLDVARYSASENLPTVKIDGIKSLELGPLQVEVFPTPGHTPGGVCYLIGSHLFTGDTLFRQTVGKTWDDDQGTAEENGQKLIRSIKNKLLPLPDSTIVYPGHGVETTIASERESNPFLLSTHDST